MREFLRAKIHNGIITKADLDYEGSLGMDSALMRQVDIRPFESIEIYNVTNGERLRTYAIELPENSGRIESNGAAAHWMRKGDRVIIAAYTWIEESKIADLKPKILILGPDNRVKNYFEGTTQPSGPQEGTRSSVVALK